MALNKFQSEVIKNRKGLNIVEATAGSGKTYTVEHLVAQILSEKPQPRVGVFTFSKNAAEELGHRIASQLYPMLDDEELEKKRANTDLFQWVSTIHALSYRILKKQGFKFRVLSGKEEWEVESLLKDLLKEMKWEQGLRQVRHWIDKATVNLIEPVDSEPEEFYRPLLREYGMGRHAGKMSQLFIHYHNFMSHRSLIDFAMMQAKVIKLIRTDADFCDKLAGMFDYVIVDEAQDTSPIQMEIIDALIRDNGNLTLAGDVDQSMYAFRGAVPEVLRRENFSRFVLPINYRSTKSIIEAGRNIIENNYLYEPELIKPFQARPKAPQGQDISAVICPDFSALEGKLVDLLEEDGEFGDWFILSRTRAECAAIHTALVSAGVPSINKSGGLLFGAPHIRKVLAYARLACNYENARNDLDIIGEIANVASSTFVSPINRRRHLEDCTEDRFWIDCGCPLVLEKGKSHTTARYYGAKSLQKARDWNGIKAQQYEKNKGGYPTMAAHGARDLIEFVELIETAKDNAIIALDTIIAESILPWLMEQEGISNEDLAENGKVEDFALLLDMVEADMPLEGFLKKVDDITKADDAEEEGEAVIIGTFHWAKGAEREKVVVNLSRCPIVPPQPRENELPMGQPPLLEEERRLAFVGVTRAKSEAYLFASKEWLDNQLPVSPFIGEIILT